jgi:hypothetical protein
MFMGFWAAPFGFAQGRLLKPCPFKTIYETSSNSLLRPAQLNHLQVAKRYNL